MLNMGTNNKLVIMLQKFGFLREEAILLSKPQFSNYISLKEDILLLDRKILDKALAELQQSIETVMINYPEIFVEKSK